MLTITGNGKNDPMEGTSMVLRLVNKEMNKWFRTAMRELQRK